MSLFGSSQSQSNPLFGSTTNNASNNSFGGSTLGGGSALFGGANQSTQSQVGGGLFGSTQSQQQQGNQQNPGTGLFSGLGQSKTTQAQQQSGGGTGLFGGLGGGSSNTQTGGGGLFGASASQPSGGIFGSTENNQQKPLGSLFGASNQNPQSQQPGGLGGSMFGASIVNNNNAQTGEPQGQAPGNGQQSQIGLGSTTTAHFQSLLEKSNKRKAAGQGGPQLGELPSLRLGLGDISGKLQKLSGSTRAVAPSRRGGEGRARDLPAGSSASRGSTLRDLNSFATSTGTILGQTVVPAAADIDIGSYIANRRAKSTQDLINESLAQTKRDFNAFLEENIQMNWQEQRQRTHEHFGIAKPADRHGDSIGGDAQAGPFGRSSRRARGPTGANGSPANMSFGASAMSRSVLGGSVSRGSVRNNLFTDVAEKNGGAPMPSAVEDPFLRSKEEKYAVKVREFNAARKQGVVYAVVEQFARVELEAGSESAPHLIDSYRALKEIVKEKGNIHEPTELGAIKERQYATDYLEETTNSARSNAFRRQILDGSRKFLEDNFYQNLDTMVSKNPQEANLGGLPSKINKIRAYLRIRAARKDLGGENAELQTLGDDYCWALIFHLLRCGLFEEAAQYVAENERAIKAMDRHFAVYMAAFARDADRKLSRDLQAKINSEYSQRVRLAPDNSIDPYRMACYKIVGRCDLPHKNIEGITMNMEDWMWLLFSLAREVNRVEEQAGETFGLEEARQVIEQIGQRHFVGGGESGNSFSTFFLMQICAGLFEKAIAYLYPHNYVAAVHFAIALNYYGLLRVSDVTVSDSELLTYTTRGQPQISFGRMLGYYTRDFRLARAETAADYLVLICLNSDLPGAAGESASAVCQQALKELVLETREFALLVGDVQANGQRVKGAIEERLPLINLSGQDDFLRTLTIQAASVASDSGRTTDAVLLYHLAEEYDNVIVIINRALSDAIAADLAADLASLFSSSTNPAQQQPIHETNSTLSLTSVDDPATLARNMISLYNANALYFKMIRPEHRDACGKLLQLSTIRLHVAAGRTAEALDAILDLGVIPLRAGGNVSVIRSAAQNFNLLPQGVARCIGNLLVWTVGCLGKEREKMLNSQFQAGRAQSEGLVQAAKDAMVFAGLVRYKLPADVFEVLARAGQGLGA